MKNLTTTLIVSMDTPKAAPEPCYYRDGSCIVDRETGQRAWFSRGTEDAEAGLKELLSGRDKSTLWWVDASSCDDISHRKQEPRYYLQDSCIVDRVTGEHACFLSSNRWADRRLKLLLSGKETRNDFMWRDACDCVNVAHREQKHEPHPESREPRTFWRNEYKHGILSGWLHSSRAAAENFAQSLCVGQVEFREVLVDENGEEIQTARERELERRLLDMQFRKRDEARARKAAEAEIERLKDCWTWVGDGNDHLESMSNGMMIQITAGDMRRFMLQQQDAIRKEAIANRRELNILKKFVKMQEAGREDEWDIVHGCDGVWDLSESATVALRLAREAREKDEVE